MRKMIKRLTKNEKIEIKNFIEQWEKFANAYFWTSPSNASCRRSYEQKNSMNLEFNFQGVQYICEIEVSCSCKNVYVNREITVDGVKKNIKALKALI